MGRDLPEFPTLFTKYADALIGANDDIVKPPETSQFDWECELAVIIGSAVRRARGAEAEGAIAGFAVLNDVTCRDWQYRTKEWLQGKSWEATTPLGPYLVTPDELPGGVRPALAITTEVDGETMQHEQHRRPPLRPGRPGRVHLDDDHPASGRRHRHRDTWRRGPRAEAGALPRRSDSGWSRRSRAWAAATTPSSPIRSA